MEDRLALLERRLAVLEAEHAVRACVTRYVALCDTLGPETPLAELAALFTVDAVWEGTGPRHAASFGRHAGRAAIRQMLARYTTEPPHFAMNAHFLCSEHIAVADDARGADATWVMLQPATFSSGASHLNAARLRLRLEVEDGAWRIAHFRTENLFGRPVSHWSDAGSPLPVPSA